MIKRVIDFIAFRTTKKYNTIKIRSLEPNYWDKDTLLLHTVMQIVVDFVEIECAFMELDSPYSWRQWLYLKLPWFLRSDEFIRNRELGLKHLDMLAQFYEDKVKDSDKAPRVIKNVYLWWKDVRPLRQEPDVVSGWSDYFSELVKTQGASANEKKEKKLIKATNKLEKQYMDEDTNMLKAIIDVRGFLWT